jgi:hypothetical protein
MDEKNADSASINLTFARVMHILTWAGLILLALCGILYISGINAAYRSSLIVQHWDKPASQFWLAVRGSEAQGYDWFLSSMPSTDSLTMAGVALLMLTPLISLLFTIWKMKGLYLALAVMLIAEFLFSIFRPFL